MVEQITASRFGRTEEQKKQLDWMHVPGMAAYVNGLVSGRPMNNRGHWAQYAADKFVSPLKEKLGSLKMVSLGCGQGHIERGLLGHGWNLTDLLGLEYDSSLREKAREKFADAPFDSRFEYFDFNEENQADFGKFDIVFSCHAIHHATNLEHFLPFINRLMHKDSLFIGIEYFGPTRFQVEHDVREILDHFYSILPEELKYNIRDKTVPKKLFYPSIDHMMKIDISESARSSDLRTMLFSNFPVIEKKPMGGTLLRWLFQFRAGNYDRSNPNHCAIAALLIELERNLISNRQVQSDDLFFVLGKSDIFGP